MTAASPNLLDLCNGLSEHFGLKNEEVLAVAARSVPVTNNKDTSRASTATGGATTGGGTSSLGGALPKGDSSANLISLNEFIPSDRKLGDLTVAELAKYLQEKAGEGDEEGGGARDENCIPFLLRHVLGEFHYGQRATGRLPGQKGAPARDSSSGTAPAASAAQPSSELKSADSTFTNTDDKVFEAFNVLAREAKYRHSHQVAGWVDLDDKDIWDNYVRDVCAGKLRDGDTVYEAGCGVLAFLRSCMELAPNLVIGGSDGAAKTIECVKTSLLTDEEKEKFADNFEAGMLPQSLHHIPDSSWDVVCCNSVFQYLPDKETALACVKEMIRVAKRWVIIADVCDSKYHDETQTLKGGLGWTSGLPEYQSYPKLWWEENFDVGTPHLVSIRHVECKTYKRRTQRYVVYIEKDAIQPAEPSS